jgi:hypothetical protein
MPPDPVDNAGKSKSLRSTWNILLYINMKVHVRCFLTPALYCSGPRISVP